MITLRWKKFPGADVESYKVYCSILGFKAPILDNVLVDGKTLVLKMNGGDEQEITFDLDSTVIERINADLSGGHAYPNEGDPGYFYLRSDVRVSPGSVEIVSGTALADFGITARMIQEKSEDFALAVVPSAENPDDMVTFEDPDGVCQDWYAVSTLNIHGEESNKSPYKQPITHSGDICVLEGIVTDLQGVRIADSEVTATLVKAPHESMVSSQVTTEPIKTRTGPDGRFSLAVLQGALIRLEIQAVAFDRNVTVPSTSCALVTDLLIDLDYRYPLEYRV